MFLNFSFKMTTSSTNVARTAASTSKLGKISNNQELGLYMKITFDF